MGTTNQSSLQSCTSEPEHPHEHGDNALLAPTNGGKTTGTPPRAWGQRIGTVLRAIPLHRNTPTSMGTTGMCPVLLMWRTPEHPHEHGDNGSVDITHHYVKFGTPPRAWGQPPTLPAWTRPATRNTPTSMGTTLAVLASARKTPGTPPRAWGQP